MGAVLETAGITDHADDPVDAYSGVMKRRLNTRQDCCQPSLLVADELTVGVDSPSRNAITEYVAVRRGEGLPLVWGGGGTELRSTETLRHAKR